MALTDGNLVKVNGSPTGGKQQMVDAGDVQTTVRADGVASDSSFATEKATRTAIDAVSLTLPTTTKGDLLAYDTDNARLPVGSDNQVLTADSGEATGLKWADVPDESPLTTKGDLFTYDTDNNRLPIGADTQVLTVDSSQPTGMKWSAPVSGGMTDPMTTRGDIIIKDATNTTARLPIGTNGQVLKSDGTDISWEDASGGGNVNNDGTPVTGEFARWTSVTEIEGISAADLRTAINVEDGAEANNISDVNATALTDGGDTALHGHTASGISDFDTEVSNNASVVANTAKVTNATHTGDVTGDEALTIADDAVTYAKMQNVVADNVLLGNNAGAGGAVDELTATEVRTLINVEDGAEANNINDTNATDLTDGNDSTLHYHAADRSRANHTGTQAASTISDFDTEVSNNTAVTANTAKVTNATHTGDVTGDGALTIATDLRTVQVDLVISGAFMDGRSVGDDLLEKVNSHLFLWRLRAGVLKSFKAIVLVDDTGGTQPQINLEIGGTEALSSDLTLAETWSTGTIDTSNDDVSTSDRLEITVANTGTNSDAEDLTVSMTWEVTSI